MARKLKTTAEIVSAPPTPPAPPEGPPCPKCGLHKGWTGPTYQKGRRVEVKVVASATRFRNSTIETTESLDYTCVACGYTRHEPTKDT